MTKTICPSPRRRWYHLSPDRLIIGLLAVEGLLFLSERFQWFAFNEKKGYSVLIAVAAVCLVAVVMLLWLVASLVFRWRFQFSVRSLVVLVVAVAIPCCWLAVKMREAERQRQAAEAIRKAGGYVWHDYKLDESAMLVAKPEPPAPGWLMRLVGVGFFSDVAGVTYADPTKQVSDAGLEHLKGLTRLKFLGLSSTQVTDTGLEHLKGMTRLESLVLPATHVTDEGIDDLRKALPNCDIQRATGY